MIRAQYFSKDKPPRKDLKPEDYPAALQDGRCILWVDFEAEPNESSEPILRNVFQFHPLSIDDALQETHVPKVDDWQSYLYVVLHAVDFQPDADNMLGGCELDIFLGRNFIVTHHDEPVAALNRVWETSHRDERNLKMGADHFLYRLTDELVVDYMNLIEDLDEESERLEQIVFSRPSPKVLNDIFTLKRATTHVRRFLSPQREVLNRLARDEFQVIDRLDRVYFRDVYDHLVRLHDIVEGLRDLVSGTLDTYLSVINNRMNDIMKALTVITTLFMPLSFLVGFFGMNFFVPDPDVPLAEWVSTPVFLVTMTIILVTPIVMYLWMRRRGWM